MNFDKANTEVTRRSYGSRVDKTFQREGVVPVKNRNKNDRDYAAESVKYNELNKRVENRKLNDVKEQKAFNDALNKGYQDLRETLIKDIMYEICIESMLVDRDDIDNNIRNVMNMVDERVEEIGGYKGFKQIAESTGNKLLLNIINTCDEMTKIIGSRNIMEAAGNASKLDFEMNKSEMDEFDYRKKSFGSETIINAVRDKVLDVVKYEQEANTSKQEIMDEIQAKVSELGAPVGEAMEFIFGQKVEETTLFDSLMRKNYKNLLATESSFIFESKGVEEDDFEYEDEDFKMSDIELIDEEDEDAIRDMFLENAYNNIIDSENLEEELNSILETLKVMTNCKSKSEAMRMKDDIRYLQLQIMEGKGCPAGADCTANNIPKEAVKNAKKVKEEVIICPDCGKDPCTCKGVNESFDFDVEEFFEDDIIEEGVLSKIEDFKKGFKQKRLTKKKEKLLKKLPVFDEAGDKYKNEFRGLVDKIESLLKKEIPGCRFNSGVIDYRDYDLGDYILYEYKVDLFEMDEKNKFRFIENSKNNTMKAAHLAKAGTNIYGKVNDMKNNAIDSISQAFNIEDSEEEKQERAKKDANVKLAKMGTELASASLYGKDLDQRIYEPIIKMGFTRQRGALVKLKDNKEYIAITTGSKMIIKAKFLVKKNEDSIKESFEPIVEGVLKNKIVMAFDNYKHKKLNKVDFDKLRNNMIQITANAKTIKELDVLERDVDFSIAELEKMKKPENEEKITFHVEFLNNEYKKFLAEKRKEMEGKQCLESFVDKLDDYCDKLSHIIETHELARNSVMESLTYTIEGETVFVPFIQPNDCNLSNLEFAYKTKTVCESLKSELKNVRNENDFMIIEKAVQMNLQSIHEAMSCIENMEKMDYKKHVLNSCEGYLNKIQHVIDNNSAPNNSVVESTSVFEDEEAVEMIFNRVKEHTLIESTSNDLMELVMAESIVEYTIMEAFNTLNLLKFDKESVRRMSRNNISSTTEGFLGK